MCINVYTLPKRSIAMLSWNVLTTSRQLLVTQLRFRYMFLSASWEHLDSFVRLLLTILDELFLVLNMFHEFSKVHGHTIRHTSCSNSYSGTDPLDRSATTALSRVRRERERAIYWQKLLIFEVHAFHLTSDYWKECFWFQARYYQNPTKRSNGNTHNWLNFIRTVHYIKSCTFMWVQCNLWSVTSTYLYLN